MGTPEIVPTSAPRRNRAFTRGFLRLSVVLYVVLVGAFYFWLHGEANRNDWLIMKHVSPYSNSGFPPTEHDWCVILASQDFLKKPEVERQEIARRFYDNNIRSLASGLYLDGAELRTWWIKTASLTLEQVPIREFYFESTKLSVAKPYRDLAGTDFPPRVQSWVVRDAALLAIPATALIVAFISMIVFTVRWVGHGFLRD